ncbi:hypothetical protein LUZ60_010073 [Juncus effusus]|nr:hypothetical protein LUZ60_010073 [Juncus effusus]
MPSQNSSEYWQQFTDYEWTDYCPEALRNIREIRGIDPDEYMLTICSLETMLLAAMPLYYSHVEKYNNTLLSKIYGIHAFKPSGGQKVRFAVVGNQMLGQKKIHKQYYFRTNLQGKILSRSGSEEDLAIGFHIEPSIREELLRYNKSPFFGVPARAVDMKRLETCRNPQTYPKLEKKNNVVLYLGIIDTNLEHSMFRIVEHMFRYLQSDNPSGTSRSKAYARNFQEMVASIFPKDGSAFNTDNFH